MNIRLLDAGSSSLESALIRSPERELVARGLAAWVLGNRANPGPKE
jgi:hypothetical protein